MSKIKLWSYLLKLAETPVGFQCLARFTTSKNSEVHHLWDPQHLYLSWFFVNLVIFNLLLPYRLGWLALPNVSEIERLVKLQLHRRWHAKEQATDLALSQLAMHLFRNQCWSLSYKMGSSFIFTLPMSRQTATLAWSNSVRCDAPFTMMAFRTHIGTCSIYLSGGKQSSRNRMGCRAQKGATTESACRKHSCTRVKDGNAAMHKED